MLLTGQSLFAALALIMAKSRAGTPRLAGKPFLEDSVALGISIAGADGDRDDFHRSYASLIRDDSNCAQAGGRSLY